MRLRLFDRIRRLAQSRRPPAETVPAVSGTQGRHRRGRRGSATAPGAPSFPGGQGSPGGPDPVRGRAPVAADRSAPGGPPAELTHTAAPWPGGSPVAEAPFAVGPAGETWRSGRIAARPPGRRHPPGGWYARGARRGGQGADPRSAPGGRAARVGRAGPQGRWQETAEPGLAQATAQAAARTDAQAAELARVAAGIPQQPDGLGRSAYRPAVAVSHAGLPFAAAHPRERPRAADGRRHCGSLEAILWRQWNPASPPPREVVLAVDRLAELPVRIKEKLADGLDAIFIGPGGVPELDDMTSLRGVSLPSGRATWDACAGAYGERKIVVGSRPSPTPDVMCHEVGHALDDLDSPPGKWQSDSAEFRMLYDQCQPHFASDFHRQPGGLGRKEFFADAFAAIASRQRPALVDMLSGDTRTALRVMLYFNRRYGI